jgi:hypothetical protein
VTRPLIVAVAFGMLIPQPTLARPPSFAVWAARQDTYFDSLVNPVGNRCQKLFARDDKKTGECIVSAFLVIYPKLTAHWERGVGRIERGQAPVCANAIHAYSLALRKNFAVALLYFKSHRHASGTEVAHDFSSKPYASLKTLKDEAKAHAIRICS